MIRSIRMWNFKNFVAETLRVGPFTVIVGANASGKGNIRDAFWFLHGIGRGYTLAEIVGGKSGPGGRSEWGPVRGATNEIVWFGAKPLAEETSRRTPAIRQKSPEALDALAQRLEAVSLPT